MAQYIPSDSSRSSPSRGTSRGFAYPASLPKLYEDSASKLQGYENSDAYKRSKYDDGRYHDDRTPPNFRSGQEGIHEYVKNADPEDPWVHRRPRERASVYDNARAPVYDGLSSSSSSRPNQHLGFSSKPSSSVKPVSHAFQKTSFFPLLTPNYTAMNIYARI